MATRSFTVRLDPELKHQLDSEAKIADRPASYLASQAIKVKGL